MALDYQLRLGRILGELLSVNCKLRPVELIFGDSLIEFDQDMSNAPHTRTHF